MADPAAADGGTSGGVSVWDPLVRLWLNDGSCIRLRPSWPNHVWAYDFVQARTHDGRALKMLTVIDEFTRECLAIEVARRLRSDDVLQVPATLPDLLDQVDGRIGIFLADGAFDGEATYNLLIQRIQRLPLPEVVVPPRAGSVE